MGRELKPIYVCDCCGTMYYDTSNVRVFTTPVYDGEKQVQYINKELLIDRMLCRNCILKELDLEFNEPYAKKLPVEFRTHSLQESIDDNELVTCKETECNVVVQEVDISTDELFTEHLDILKNIDLEIDRVNKILSEPEEFIHENKEVEIHANISFKKDESPTEETDYLDDGKFLVLFKISNQQEEEKLAKFYNQSLEKLRENCGKSLIGVYVSTDKYINNLKESTIITKEVQVINKIFMGIPNIDKRIVFIDTDDKNLAYIEKIDFDLQIESYNIEVPKDPEENEESFEEKDVTYEFIGEESEYI